MLRQQVSEIRAGQRKDYRRLNCRDGGRPRLSGQQRHFANRCAVGELRHQEIDAGRRILLSNLHQARLDDVHRNAGRTFADDHFGGREIPLL